MRVALDASALLGPPGGVATFVSHLIENLPTLEPAREVRPYTLSVRGRLRGRVRGTWLPVPAGIAGRVWSGRGPLSRFGVDWALGDFDVIHGTNYVVPPSRRASVVSVHDLSFVHRPQDAPAHVRRFDSLVAAAVRRGAWVHVLSSFVGEEVSERYGTDRVRVVLLGAPGVLPESTAAKTPAILSIATETPRKRLPLLVRAFGAIAEELDDHELWLAGGRGADSAAIDTAVDSLPLSIRSRVRRLGVVSAQDRTALLSEASVAAYPSIYEGFGLPVLEAMAAGVPVVASNASSVPEAAGGAAELVSPDDLEELAAALRLVLTDEGRARQLIEAGRARAAAMTWTRTAEGMADLYDEAYSG